MTERVICVGDPHGCFNELMLLLEKIKYSDGSDKLLILGDLVDRGPDSAKMVRWLRTENKKNPEKVQCIMGNHEDKHLRYFKHVLEKRKNPNYKIPMRPFSMEKLQVFNSLEDEDLIFLENLPHVIYLGPERDWVAVHAGLEPKKDLWHQEPGKVTHLRFLHPETFKRVSLDGNYLPPRGSIYWTEAYTMNHHVVYGHHVHSLSTPEITIKPNGAQLVGIDTGCCFGGRLSAFILPETKEERVAPSHFVQVQAAKVYSRSLINTKE